MRKDYQAGRFYKADRGSSDPDGAPMVVETRVGVLCDTVPSWNTQRVQVLFKEVITWTLWDMLESL